uniref:HAT C-terminal dimerisation domain-containing protein n=1 Tax=Arundo donax TaxID=35708 RepID=A0A0A9FHH7_ARUDO
MGERIITDFRSSLAPKTVEALICLQDWYRVAGSTEFSLTSIHDEADNDGTMQ